MLLLWICASVILAYVLNWYVKRRIHLAPLSKFPGSPPRFLFGHLSWILKLYSTKSEFDHGVYIYERIQGTYEVYRKEGIIAFWFGPLPIISVYCPEGLEVILSSNTCLDKSYEYKFLHPWLGRGLLTSTSSKWRSRRKLLTPTLHFRILEDFVPVFNEQSDILVSKLQSRCHQPFVDTASLIVLCALDIICETIMGVSIGAQTNENSDYVRALQSLGEAFNHRTVQVWKWPDFLFALSRDGKEFASNVKTMHSFTEKVIKEKKREMQDLRRTRKDKDAPADQQEVKVRKTFMNLLLDLHLDGEQLDEKDIREEVDTFMFEGHDTTTAGMVFALYFIGLYPEVQKKIFEELVDIFGDDLQRAITYDDTRQMKYLECVLKESQRIFPSVPIISRITSEELTIGEYVIPAGTTVHCGIMGAHRNPEIFPNPEVFDPDRFLIENSVNRHPFAYVPFSAGPRNCIGQKFAMLEEKIVVSNVLRNFQIQSLDPRDKMHVKIELVLRPVQPIRIKFVRRDSA